MVRLILKERKSLNEQGVRFRTFGELKKAINNFLEKKDLKSLVGTTINIGANFVPGAGAVTTAYDLFKKINDASTDIKTNTILDKFQVDKEFSQIVDDKIEIAFLKYFVSKLQQTSDTDPLPADFDINNELQKYLSARYLGRTIAKNK